jgi:hypothetical protein
MDAVWARYLKAQVDYETLNMSRGAVVIFIIWHTVLLIQLKSFSRWFSVVFFALWTLLAVVRVTINLSRFLLHPPVLFHVLILVGCNVACIWYLTRSSFREFAVKYVTEHQQEKKLRDMQKFSQEQIRKGKF